jgi:hypothetical protein
LISDSTNHYNCNRLHIRSGVIVPRAVNRGRQLHKKDTNSRPQMASQDITNITLRKKLIRSKSELDLSSMTNNILNSTILDSTMLSINSEIPANESITYEELSQEILSLKKLLQQSEHEIDNLNLENNELKRTIDGQNKQFQLLKAITTEIGLNNKSITPIRRKITQINTSITKTSPLHLGRSVIFNAPCFNKRTEHSDTHKQMTTQHTNINAPTMTTDVADLGPAFHHTTQTQHNIINKEQKTKNRMCVISSNNRNKILNIMKKTFDNKYNVCHYSLPGAGLENIIEGIENKIYGFTMSDYCVVLL